MELSNIKRCVLGVALVNVLGVPSVNAADAATGILGRNEWLFYRYEMTDARDAEKTNVTLDLIQRFNKVLAANNIALGVAMVPLKMRIYAEHLPDDVKINDYMGGNNERMTKVLRDAGVHVMDLNTAFLNSPKRASDSPLFFRLDQNWSPSGVLVAAEAVKAGILAAPMLKNALDAMPEEEFRVVLGNRKRASKGRDLVQYLPPNSPSFAPEQVAPVTVNRVQPPKVDALGNRVSSGITLLGSGYSHDWTGFADALRYVLQRDVLSIGVGTDRGSWVGMETYLRSNAFQTKAPKILIWEMPERDMRAPPDYQYRDARYQSDNNEWLLRVSALVQTECRPSSVATKLTSNGLAANKGNWKGGEIVTGPVNDDDFIEVGFDKPIDKHDYLWVRAAVNGAKAVVFEGSGPGVVPRRFTLNVSGDEPQHAFKIPLLSRGVGFTKLRIFPGQISSFSLQGIQVCRQPDDLLH